MSDFKEIMEMYEQDPAIVIITCGIVALLWLVSVIAKWKIFGKMGVAGWLAIIPLVSEYVLIKHCWSKEHAKRLIVFSILDLVFFLFSDIFGSFDNTPCLILSFVFGALEVAAMVYCAYLSIRICFRQSRAFGHGYGYGFGLLFLPFIFDLILGFGKDEYIGPAPLKTEKAQVE